MSRKEDFKQKATEYNNNVNMHLDFYNGAEYGYQYALQHPQWIPVEERLPKEKQKVLVYMPSDERCDHEYMCEALYNYAWHKWEDADEPIELEGITHWMEIVPPQGKEG